MENGITDKDDIVVKTMVSRYLEPIKRENVDLPLILGCTHYPLLRDAIAEYMGESVKLISSGAEAAKYTMNMLAMNNMLSSRSENGHVTYFTSDSKMLLESNAHAFIGSLNGSVEQICIKTMLLCRRRLLKMPAKAKKVTITMKSISDTAGDAPDVMELITEGTAEARDAGQGAGLGDILQRQRSYRLCRLCDHRFLHRRGACFHDQKRSGKRTAHH